METVEIAALGCDYDGPEERWYLTSERWTIRKDEDESGPFYGVAEPDEDGSRGYWEDFPTLAKARAYLKRKNKERLAEWNWHLSGRDE